MWLVMYIKVTILYDLEPDTPYSLTQTAAPKGFVGLQKEVRFLLHEDGTVSLYESDGKTAWIDKNRCESDGFEWALNGDVQPLMPATGGKFRMKHGDHVELLLPDGADVTLQEQNGAYRTTILRNEAETVEGNCIQFTFTD